MTINSPAAPIWAMYIVAAEKAGVPRDRLEGTTQNDILKEFVAQKEYLFPPEPSMRLVTDTIEFGTRELPRWNTVSISGYHIREAGSTAVQELAFTIADGMAYVEAALARGLRIDDFAPRLSFFFNSHSDFFEEIAKFRASRRIWHRLMTERYGAENERSAWMRFHTQTAGVSLTPQQPLNNLTRVALQALAAVLGGTQSLHTDAYDEALAVPTAEAALLALRQQQIIAEETRRGRHGRPARRLVVRRGADQRDRGRGAGATSTRSTGAAGWSRPSPRAIRSARSPTPPIATSASSMPGSGGSSGSTPTSTRRRRRPCRSWPCRPARWSATWRGSSGRGASVTPTRSRRRSRGLRDAGVAARVERDEPDAALRPLRRGVRDARRAVRRAARGLRGVPRAGRGLTRGSPVRRAATRPAAATATSQPSSTSSGGPSAASTHGQEPTDEQHGLDRAQTADPTDRTARDGSAWRSDASRARQLPDAARVDREGSGDRHERAEDLRPGQAQALGDRLEADRVEGRSATTAAERRRSCR